MQSTDIKIGAHVDLTDKANLVLLRYYCTMALKADGAGIYQFTPKKLAYDAGYSVARWDEADSHRVYNSLIEIMKKIETKEWDFASQVQIYLPVRALKEHRISGKTVFYAKCSEKPCSSDSIFINCHALEAFLETCKQHPRNGDNKFALLLAISKSCALTFNYASLLIRGGKTTHDHLIAETSLDQRTITRLIKWFDDNEIFLYQPGFMIPNGPWDTSCFVMTNIPKVRDLFIDNCEADTLRNLPDELASIADAYTPIKYVWERNYITATS